MDVSSAGIDHDQVEARLAAAPFDVIGRFAAASNATLLVRLTDRSDAPPPDVTSDDPLAHHDPADLAVHKPGRGERPLWDFPVGTLHRREVAARLVSEALGMGLVPPTVLREDGPFGPGSLQAFVPHDPSDTYFTLMAAGDPDVHRRLIDLVVLDLVIDNADRKGGHVLLAQGDAPVAERIVAVDHGVTFNVEPKLRTVAWDSAGEPVPVELTARLGALLEALERDLGDRLGGLLAADEVVVLTERVARLATMRALPAPTSRYDFPWPLL